MNVWKMLSEQLRLSGSRGKIHLLRPSAIACGSRNSKVKTEALGQSEDVILPFIRAGDCQEFRLLCCETLCGRSRSGNECGACRARSSVQVP